MGIDGSHLSLLKGLQEMDLAVIRYAVFVVAALILIWAILEMRWRMTRKSRQPRTRIRRLGSWVDLDTTAGGDAAGDPPGVVDAEAGIPDAQAAQDLQERAQQNGHFSGSKKKL
jgi:hypothetical protein